MALADVKATYNHPHIHPDITGTHGFHVTHLYFLATAMVFGSKASESSWEAFQQSTEALSKVYANWPDLKIKHRKYLGMIFWESPALMHFNTGSCLLIESGFAINISGRPREPLRIDVDDALMFGLCQQHIGMLLVAIIEASFAIMGKANTSICQCSPAMDKWNDLVVGAIQMMLDLVVVMNRLTVAIRMHYVTEVHLLLDTT